MISARDADAGFLDYHGLGARDERRRLRRRWPPIISVSRWAETLRRHFAADVSSIYFGAISLSADYRFAFGQPGFSTLRRVFSPCSFL